MPLHHGRELHQHYGGHDLRPNAVEPHPEQPVCGEEPKPGRLLTPQNCHLMSKGDELQGGAATNTEGEQGNEGGKYRDHVRNGTVVVQKSLGFLSVSNFEYGQVTANGATRCFTRDALGHATRAKSDLVLPRPRTLLRTRSGGCPEQVEPLLFSVEAVQSSSAAQLVTFSRNGPVLERVIIPVRASHVPNPTHPLVTRVRQATRARWGRICSVRQTVQVRLYRTALRLE